MAAIFRLTPTAPGQARIDVTGVALPAPDQGLEVSFESSEDTYIGRDGSWQDAPYWHRLERFPGPATSAFLAGPVIVDALSQAGSCFASARWKDGQAAGVLRITGELIGSAGLKSGPAPDAPSEHPEDQSGPPIPTIPPIPGALSADEPAVIPLRRRTPVLLAIGGLLLLVSAAGALWRLGTFDGDPTQGTAREASPGVPTASDTDQPNAARQPDAEPPANTPQGPAHGQADRPAAETPATGPTPNGGAATASPSPPRNPKTGAPSDAPGGLSQSQSGQPAEAKPGTGPTPAGGAAPVSPANGQTNTTVPPDARPGPGAPGPNLAPGAQTATEPTPVPTPYDAPQLKGPEYVSWLIDQAPDAATYRSQAERRAKQGDCAAAILLNDRAARANPEAAAQVARLYDPAGFRPSPCITQPSVSNAREYYELAGAGGVADVQPRLEAIRGQRPAPVPTNRTWENRQ